MERKLCALTSLTSEELKAVNGGGFWSDWLANIKQDLKDFADGWHDAGAVP